MHDLSLLLRIVFPLPPISLKANRRMGQHWGGTHRDKASYRDACILTVKHILRRSETKQTCHMVATVYLGARQRCDPSDLGAWCKVPIDVLVSEGFIASDSAACIKSFTAIVERDATNPRLEIEVRGLIEEMP